MLGKILAHPFILGAIGFLGYEAYNKYQLANQVFVLTPGHQYTLLLSYSGTGQVAASGGGLAQTLTQAQAQNALSTVIAGANVISCSENTNPKQLAISFVNTSTTVASYTGAQLAGGSTTVATWPNGYAPLTVISCTDMGGGPSTTTPTAPPAGA